MKILTDHVSPDEACHGLREGPRTMPMPNGSQQRRWVQAVYVVRDDAIAEYTVDYGPAHHFEDLVMELVMPSFGENSVAQLQEFAEKNRHERYWAKRREEMMAESTLIEDVVRQRAQDREIIRNRSVIGPNVRVQRGAYSADVARRRLKEKVHANGHKN